MYGIARDISEISFKLHSMIKMEYGQVEDSIIACNFVNEHLADERISEHPLVLKVTSSLEMMWLWHD